MTNHPEGSFDFVHGVFGVAIVLCCVAAVSLWFSTEFLSEPQKVTVTLPWPITVTLASDSDSFHTVSHQAEQIQLSSGSELEVQIGVPGRSIVTRHGRAITSYFGWLPDGTKVDISVSVYQRIGLGVH